MRRYSVCDMISSNTSKRFNIMQDPEAYLEPRRTSTMELFLEIN